MNRKGPLFTLLGGLALAGILLGASISAANDEQARRNAAANGANGGAVGAAPTTAPTKGGGGGTPGPTAEGGGTPGPTAEVGGAPGTTGTGKPPNAGPKTTYAGRVTGAGRTVLAISIHNGKAIAYLCDGATLEEWFQGTAKAGKLTLTGGNGAKLTGEYGSGKALGSVTANGKTWTFTAPAVAPPSGLYRAVANVADARVVGGWIRLKDGTQTGLLRKNGVAQPAPPLDENSNSIDVDGTTVTASAVDPEAGL